MVYYYREGKGPRGAFSSILRSFRETANGLPRRSVHGAVLCERVGESHSFVLLCRR